MSKKWKVDKLKEPEQFQLYTALLSRPTKVKLYRTLT
jgi:hypothetical protein